MNESYDFYFLFSGGSLGKALELSSLNAKYAEALAASANSASEEEEDDTLEGEPTPSVVPRTGRKSVTFDLFHQWLASGSRPANVASILPGLPSSPAPSGMTAGHGENGDRHRCLKLPLSYRGP